MANKIAVICGSNRKESSSTQLAYYIQRILREKEYEGTVIHLYRQPLPFYAPDENENHDPNLVHMKETVMEADGIVLATPEYHGSISGVLKNSLDHLSSEHFSGKIVLSVSSAGGAVGVSSLQQLHTIVRNLHGINCPEWISIGGAERNFTAEGEPETVKIKDRIIRTTSYFLHMLERFPRDSQ